VCIKFSHWFQQSQQPFPLQETNPPSPDAKAPWTVPSIPGFDDNLKTKGNRLFGETTPRRARGA